VAVRARADSKYSASHRDQREPPERWHEPLSEGTNLDTNHSESDVSEEFHSVDGYSYRDSQCESDSFSSVPERKKKVKRRALPYRKLALRSDVNYSDFRESIIRRRTCGRMNTLSYGDYIVVPTRDGISQYLRQCEILTVTLDIINNRSDGPRIQDLKRMRRLIYDELRSAFGAPTSQQRWLLGRVSTEIRLFRQNYCSVSNNLSSAEP